MLENGMLFRRMELLFEGKSEAGALFNRPYCFAEQLGYRKIIDTTFMIASMINGDQAPEDIKRYFHALGPTRHRPAPGALHPLR